MSCLSFDIETTGLDPKTHAITCIAVYGDGVDKVFLHGDWGGALDLLDSARAIGSFNGARFDMNFLLACAYIFFKKEVIRLQVSLGLDPHRVGEWRRKLIDLFEICYLCFGQAFSLNKLLDANGMESKTGTGADAVRLAKEGKWDELAAYCRQDTIKTHRITFDTPCVRLPLRNKAGVLFKEGKLFFQK